MTRPTAIESTVSPPARADETTRPGFGGRAIVHGTAVQVLGKGLSSLLGLATIAIIARSLGTSGFGNYSLAMLAATVTSTFADLGLSAVAVRGLSADGLSRLWPLIRIKTCVQLVVYGLAAAVIATGAVAAPIRGAALLAVLSAAIASISTSMQLPFQAQVRWIVPTVADISVKTSTLLVVSVIAIARGSLDELVAAAVVGNMVGVGLLTRFVTREQPVTRGRLTRTEVKTYLGSSLSLGVVVLAGFAHFKVDSLIIAAVRPARDLGIYSVAYRYVEVALLVSALFLRAAFPHLNRTFAEKSPAFPHLVQRYFDGMVASGLAVALFIGVSASPLARILGGSAFAPAAMPLRLLAIAVFFAWVSSLFAQLAVVADIQRGLIAFSIFAVGVNVAINLFAVPRYGYNGAAVTTDFSEAFAAIGVSGIVLRRLDISLSLGRSLKLLAVGVGAGCWMLLGTHVLPHDLVMGLTSVAYVPLVALWWRGARAELRPDQ